jgi:hypothetical protein
MAIHGAFVWLQQSGNTALLNAVMEGDTDCVRLLVNAAADINANKNVRAFHFRVSLRM